MRKKQKHAQVQDPVVDLERKISQHRSAFVESTFHSTVRSAVQEARTKLSRIIGTDEKSMKWRSLCLGLGSLSENRVSRIQFSILEYLLELLGATRDTCLLYDPHFSVSDKQYLRQIGYEVIEENEEGRHRVALTHSDEFLLLYMPHCGTVLYENFFAENWTSTMHVDQPAATAQTLTLNRTLFVGNQLSVIRDRSLERVWCERYPHLLFLSKHAAFERTLDYVDEPHAHSDTALQLFTLDLADVEFERLRNVRVAYDADTLDIVLKEKTDANTNAIAHSGS